MQLIKTAIISAVLLSSCKTFDGGDSISKDLVPTQLPDSYAGYGVSMGGIGYLNKDSTQRFQGKLGNLHKILAVGLTEKCGMTLDKIFADNLAVVDYSLTFYKSAEPIKVSTDGTTDNSSVYTRTTSGIIKNKTLDKTFTIGQVAELRTNQGSSVVVQILNSGGGQEGLLNIKYSATSPTCVLIINMPWSSSDDGYAVRKKAARRIIYEALSASQRALEKTEKYLLSDINTRPFGFHPPKSFTENGAIELEMPSIDIQFKFKPMDLANVSRSGDRFKICENPALELLYTGVTSDFDVKTDPNELDSIKIDPFDFDVFERTLTLRNRKLIVLNTKAGRAANFFLQLNNSAGVQVDRPGDIEYYDSGLVWKLGVKKFTEELEKNCSNFVWEKIAVK